MDWTLEKIELENFKYFNGPFEFPVKGKNVLLYGENGSGKSSIVWGLYTLMESRRKPVAEVQKYFDFRDDQHLRNRYCKPGDPSNVKTTFNPLVAGAGAIPKNYEISLTNITTQAVADDFMKYTTAAFDMFNYRMLSEWIYQKNSRDIDLFRGFEKDIFKYLYFRRSYVKVDGTSSAPDGTTAEEWWNYIKSVRLPLTRRGQVNRKTVEYSRFITLLSDFKAEMDYVLMQVEHSANDMLHNDLILPNISLVVDITNVPFNQLKPGRRRYKDGKVHNPTISVEAHVVDTNVPGWSTDIKHLATFFNESKLTCIGIALRLAISDYKLISTGDVSPVLCIDDLLLSLDMSARIPVINLLLKKTQNRQFLVFTHDRAFYETMQMLIRERREDSKWCFYEMLEKKTAALGTAPKPWFHPIQTYREKAEYHFENGDYPASANYLRKYCEQQLKRILPQNLQLVSKSNGEVTQADMSGLIGKFTSDFCTLYSIALADLPSVTVYRKRLLNPLSHDDSHTPVFKAELMGAVAEIDKLKAIADSMKTVCEGLGHHRDEFTMTVSNGTVHETIDFDVLEKWTSVEVGGIRYFKDVKLRVISSTTVTVNVQDYDSLRGVFDTVCTGLGLNVPPATPPAMESTIINRSSGLALTAI